MGERTRRGVPDEGFELDVPAGWESERDPEEGGLDVWDPEGPGDLHVVGFTDAAEDADPAEELYAFLDEQDIELEEDEVEDVALEAGGELAYCEYQTEDEETGETIHWLLGVAALPSSLVFAHYMCPAGEEEQERSAVLDILRTLRPHMAPDAGA
jgi:hypothetical protein